MVYHNLVNIITLNTKYSSGHSLYCKYDYKKLINVCMFSILHYVLQTTCNVLSVYNYMCKILEEK